MMVDRPVAGNKAVRLYYYSTAVAKYSSLFSNKIKASLTKPDEPDK